MSDPRKQALREKLSQTRLKVRTLLMRLNEEQWNTTVYQDDVPWTVIEMVRHFVQSERGLITNVQRIREGGEGVPADFDLSRWNRSRVKKYADKTPKELLAEMAENRVASLEVLDDLNDDDWDKTGRAPWLEIVTIDRFMQRLWEHEMEHCTDIANALGLPFE